MRRCGFGVVFALSTACAARSPSLPPPTSLAPTVRAPVAPVDPLDVPVPIYEKVKKGKLPNGLTYYVRRHGRPEGRAEPWLAVDAGSVLQNDDHRGLAHFVEHMAFNGTARFPKHDITDFLERAGMVMGADANATTGSDHTVYRFTVPTDDEAVILRGL